MSSLVLNARPCASSAARGIQVMQRRAATGGQTSGSFKVKSKNKNEPEKIPHGARIPLYKPMPSTSLKQPIFMADDPVDLKLAKFLPTRRRIGSVARLGKPEEGPMRWFGMPKKMLLEFRLLSEPCSLIRDITVATTDMLDTAKSSPSKDNRLVLTGRKGCGKSFLLLQVVEHCAANDWIVFYFPRAVQTVNSTTQHTYDIRTQTYVQPDHALQTLQRFQSTNAKLLKELTTIKSFQLERREIPSGTPLNDLINIGIKESALAPLILSTVFGELGLQKRFPVLLAIDDFQALYTHHSAYRDPHFNKIKPHHLSMPRLLLEYASGMKSFGNGVVLGAVTMTDPSYPVPIELREQLKIPHAQATSAYEKKTKESIEYARGLKAIPVPEQLSLDEASGLFDLWMKDRALSANATDELFLSKYTESSGNARDFVWKGLLSTLEGAPPPQDPNNPFPQLRLLT